MTINAINNEEEMSPASSTSDGAIKPTLGVNLSRVVIPTPVTLFNNLTGVALPTVASGNMFVSLVHIDAITAAAMSYNVTGAAGSAAFTTRIGLYTPDGRIKLADVTDNVGTATGVRRIALAGKLALPQGYYYLAVTTAADGGAGVASVSLLQSVGAILTAFNAGSAADAVLMGLLGTVVAGVLPNTINPTAITATPDRTLALRIQGAI